MTLHAKWSTRPGIKPAHFIYLATDGFSWRVHASVNSSDGRGRGRVWHHQYYRDKATAFAAVTDLIEGTGGTSRWISSLMQ